MYQSFTFILLSALPLPSEQFLFFQLTADRKETTILRTYGRFGLEVETIIHAMVRLGTADVKAAVREKRRENV